MRVRLVPALLPLLAISCARTPVRTGDAPERIVSVGGGAGMLRVSDGGSAGPAVVFLHGLGDDRETWRAQLDHLRAAGRRAVAYDQRGHGESDRARDGVYTIDSLAADLDAVVRALGLGRVVLVGHSISGTVLTAYAGAHPESVAGLAYLDAVGDFSGVPPAGAEAFVAHDGEVDGAGRRKAFGDMLGPKARPSTRERLLAAVSRLDPKAFVALRRSLIEFRAKPLLPLPACPATAIESDDATGNPIMASKVLGLSRTTIGGVSHWMQMDDPVTVNAAIDAFLATIHQR